MGLRINTNIQAMAAQRSLSENRAVQEKTLERLSSGKRITRAGDDAASGRSLARNQRVRRCVP